MRSRGSRNRGRWEDKRWGEGKGRRKGVGGIGEGRRSSRNKEGDVKEEEEKERMEEGWRRM